MSKNKTKAKNLSRRRKMRRGNRSKMSLNSVYKGFVSGDPFKQRMFCKLQYTDDFSLSTGVTTGLFGAIQKYRLNSLYDPDLTGTGNQPYAFDQMATLYSRYKVHGVTITVEISNPSQDGLAVGSLISNPSDSTTLLGATLASVKEKPMSNVRLINNTGSQITRFKTYIPMNQAFNVTKEQFKNDLDNSTAGVGGNPGTVPHIQFAALNTSDTTNAGVRVVLRMEFFCQFYQRVVQSQS